jgi:hypothetical protein
MDTFKVGDPVSVLPPWDDLPYILSFQHYAYVASITPDGCMVRLDGAFPPRQVFGPVAPQRLVTGWRDENGRWRITA